MLAEVKRWLLAYAQGVAEREADDRTQTMQLTDSDADEEPEQLGWRAEALRLVAKLMAKWPEERRRIVLLRLEDIPAALVAEIINLLSPDRDPPMTPENVHTIYSRARAELRSALLDHGYFAD